ncbi:MAG: tetratricopeptide repeat protein [Vicinamibacterales bacterium]
MRPHALLLPILLVALLVPACDRAVDPATGDDAGVSTARLIGQARDLDLAGRHAEAIPIFRRALARDADSFDAHYGLARALDLDGQYAEAREHFTRAIALASDSTREQAQRMLGIAWTFAGDAGEAAPWFRRVYDARLAAGNLLDAADVASELGRVYLELDDVDQAETWYRTGFETSEREPGRTPAQVNLAAFRWAHAQARIAARRGSEAEARRRMAAAREILDRGGNDDQRIQYAYLAGYVEYSLGHDRAAIEALERADQEDPFILLLLARAHERLGEVDAAHAYYARVLASSSHAVNNAFARPAARRALDPAIR